MVATPQIAIQAEDQHRLDACIVGYADIRNVSSQFPRSGIVLSSEPSDSPQILLRSRNGDPFGKYPHHRVVLFAILVSTHNIVI
jgi:hypothetical protein